MSITRKALFTLAAVGLAAFAAHPASAQTTITISGLFDTGVGANAVSLPNGTVGDPHYKLQYFGLTAPTSTRTGTSETDEVRTSAGGYPFPPYNDDSTTSAWIGPAGSDPATYSLSGPQGYYEYTTTFTVSGLSTTSKPGSLFITGNWATDNTGTDILVNGKSTGNTHDSSFQYAPFSFSGTYLHSGSNTLTFVVDNTVGDLVNPTALRVDGIHASAAPEPSQIGMLALAALGLGALAVKARKRSTAAQAA